MAVDNQSESSFRAGEEEIRDYHPLSGLAVLGLVLGLVSVVAFFGPVFWIAPVAAIFVNLAALRQVTASARGIAYVGGRAAFIGLCLAVMFGTAAVVQAQTADWIMRRQARNVEQHWFQYVLDGRLELARQLTIAADGREAQAERLPQIYASNPMLGERLRNYEEQDAVRFLRSLGGKATVSHVMTREQENTAREDVLLDVYQVEYMQDGEPQSRLMSLLLLRESRLRADPFGWHVSRADPDFDPDAD